MIRMLGAVCLAAGPVWLGMSAAAELAHRERALGALCAGLELMERELALRLTPLPQLMEELAHQTEEPRPGPGAPLVRPHTPHQSASPRRAGPPRLSNRSR